MSEIPTIEELRKLSKFDAINVLENIIGPAQMAIDALESGEAKPVAGDNSSATAAIEERIQNAYSLADDLGVWVGQRESDVAYAEIRVRDGGEGRLCYFKHYINRDGTEFLAERLGTPMAALACVAEEIVPVTWGGANATS
jgi:hypothetical protein